MRRWASRRHRVRRAQLSGAQRHNVHMSSEAASDASSDAKPSQPAMPALGSGVGCCCRVQARGLSASHPHQPRPGADPAGAGGEPSHQTNPNQVPCQNTSPLVILLTVDYFGFLFLRVYLYIMRGPRMTLEATPASNTSILYIPTRIVFR